MPYSARHTFALLGLGLVFHVVFSSSIFDCYFRSPVVHGMKHYGSNPRGSKRLVLFVGDGLRADTLFTPTVLLSNDSAQEAAAPYLRSIIEEHGAFGISHTRIPTETRPGHLAIIAGMYEDASEITKGWSDKPIDVDFDSVFNQSSHTFIFGAPDILPIFADPAVPSNIHGWAFEWQALDYTKDASVLDTWVLNRFHTLLQNASEDAVLNSELRKDKVVFFLHLLGVDNTGHSYRPHSKEYLKNIRIVDNIVRETEKLVSDFYGDEETSFVFTADHGMTNIGNHGDGDPDCTRTPLIVWGKGARGPLPDSSPSSHDEYSRPWKLEHLLRRDISQADIAPIMASLLGVDWPVNSIGVLPDIDPTRPGFLELGGEEGIAQAALTNMQVLLEHYRVKDELKRAKTLFYSPYDPLEKLGDSGTPVRVEKLASIEQSVRQGEWSKVHLESVQLMNLCLEGLHYLDTYDSFFIRSVIAIGYVGWAAYTSISLFPATLNVHTESNAVTWLIDVFTLLVFLGFGTVFWTQNSPTSFYLYIAFPCYFWREFFMRGIPAIIKVVSQSAFRTHQLSVHALLIVVSMWAMVAAYTYREIWSVGFFIIGVLWPYCTWPPSTLSRNWKLALQWSVSCLVTGIFPLLPIEKKETLSTVMFGGITMLIIGATYTWRSEPGTGLNSRRIFASLQIILLAAMMVVTFGSVRSLQAKNGLPSLNNFVAWTILVISPLYSFISPVRHTSPVSKIMSFFLAFGVCFVVLSICDEGLFLSSFTCNLLLWVNVEVAVRMPLVKSNKKSDNDHYRFQLDDVRIALFFIFFVQIAFFGAGNVASISSFFLEPVYRLVTIYNPYLVLLLLMFKILIPFMILSLVFATLTARLHLRPFSLLFLALTIADGMTLTFFLNVTDTGSWFEIGRSINAFCTASLLVVWSTGACAIGSYIMQGTLVRVSSGSLLDGEKDMKEE